MDQFENKKVLELSNKDLVNILILRSDTDSNITITNSLKTIPDAIDNTNIVGKETSKDLPEPFEIQFLDNGYFSKTPPLLIFNTTDASSGIDHYEISKDGGSKLEIVTSPLPIHKSILRSTIIIRAVDFDGNSRESHISIPGVFSSLALAILIMVLLIFAYSRFLWYKKRR